MTTFLRRWLLVALAFASIGSLGAGISRASTAAQPAPVKTDRRPQEPYDLAFVHKYLQPGQYMPCSDIKAGMVGYGLSVFRGTHPEKFNVTVIGVVKKMLNGRDAILVRLSGPMMGNNNVIKGMSGSPVYINGKLIGAVSFGYDFSKEPIAGITPICDMLDALAPQSGDRGPIAHLSESNWVDIASKRANTASGAPRLIPLMSPVALVGFSPRAEEFLADRFKNFGMTVSSGAAGGMDNNLSPSQASTLQPGSAISVLLTTGDFNTVATGTVTARFGGKVIAFGHPFLQAGAVDFPMATAYIHEILPSLSASFKVASPISVVGSVLSDRPWSLGGQVGRTSKLVPTTFTVTDETRNLKRTFNCNIIDHPDLTPELLAATAISAIDATHQSSGPYVAKVDTTIEAEGIEPIHRVDRYSSNFSSHGLPTGGAISLIGDPVGTSILHLASSITDNDFQKSSLKKVKVDITLEDGHETAEIQRVYLDKPYVAPGDTVTVNCILKPYDKPARVEAIPVQIPRGLPDGNLLIGVASGDSLGALKKRMGLSDPTPESLKQVAEKIADRGRGDALNVVLALPEQSLIVGGQKLIDPPAHWARVFYSNRHTKGPSLVKGDLRVARVTDWLLDGSHLLTVEVRSPEKVNARQAAYAIQPQTNEEGIISTEKARKTIESSRKHESSSSSSGTSEANSADKPLAPISTSNKDFPHMRPMLVWKQDSDEDFQSGKTHSVTIDSWGRMSAAYQETANKALPTEMQIWSGLWAQNHFWFGSKDQLWKWKGDKSAPEVVAKFDGVAVPALAANSKGTIFAASVPDGKVYAITSGGTSSVFFHPGESIITSLCTDKQDNLYVGTGATGQIYRLDPSGHSSVFFKSGQAHITCMFYCEKDSCIYAGTGEKGTVYKIDSEGKASAIYQSPDHIVTGVVKDNRNDLYVSTAGTTGHLFRVLPSGEIQTLATSDAFYTLLYDPQHDATFSGDAEGDVTRARIDPISGQAYFIPVCHTEEEAVLSLASDGQHLYAGTSNLASVRSFEMKTSSAASYESPVHDAGRPAHWSRLRALGAFNEQNIDVPAQIKVETRTGDSSQPDETWSAWKESTYSQDAFVVAAPPARYLQYRMTWKAPAAKDKAPVILGRVEVSYLPADAAPKIASVSLKPATAMSGKHDLTVSGTDPDNDNLLLSIAISPDGARSWQPLVSDLRPKRISKAAVKEETSPEGNEKTTAASETREKSSDEDKDKDKDKDKNKDKETKDGDKDAPKEGEKDPLGELSKKVTHKSGKDKAKDKDKSKDLKANIVRLPLEKKPEKSSNDNSSGAKITAEDFSWSFDTSKLKDGNYIVKFTVDDRPSNPEDHHEAVALRSVTIDNAPPEIESMDSSRDADGNLKIKITAVDKLTPITNATFKIDDGEPFALGGVDGGTDGLQVTLGAGGLKVKPGSHKLEVKLSDAAGNSVTKNYTVR